MHPRLIVSDDKEDVGALLPRRACATHKGGCAEPFATADSHHAMRVYSMMRRWEAMGAVPATSTATAFACSV
jgi:hypothetical protein